MGFANDVIDGIEKIVRDKYDSLADTARKSKVAQPVIWKIVNRKVNSRLDVVGRLMDHFGARVVFPGDIKDRIKNCHFEKVASQGNVIPNEADYRAIPKIDGASINEDAIAKEEQADWFLVDARSPAFRFRKNIIAVVLGQGQSGMSPTITQGDTVVVDLNDKTPTSGGDIYFVRFPDGSFDVRRVAIDIIGGKTQVVFYCDDRSAAPRMFTLEDSYGGNIARAILGRIVSAQIDVTKK